MSAARRRITAEGDGVAPLEDGGVWVIMMNGQRHTFASNAEAWLWLDRQERRTPWRTVYYSVLQSTGAA